MWFSTHFPESDATTIGRATDFQPFITSNEVTFLMLSNAQCLGGGYVHNKTLHFFVSLSVLAVITVFGKAQDPPHQYQTIPGSSKFGLKENDTRYSLTVQAISLSHLTGINPYTCKVLLPKVCAGKTSLPQSDYQTCSSTASFPSIEHFPHFAAILVA